MIRLWKSAFLMAGLGAWLTIPVSAQTATFDFDTGTPPTFAGQGIPLTQTTGGITATFSSPQGLAFSVQNDGSTSFRLSQFTGNYLMPNNLDRNVLDIVFSQPVNSITLTFCTVDNPNPAEIPGDLQLTAYVDAVGTTPVGTVRTHGNYLGDTFPMGRLSFNSGGPLFNVVELVVPYQPQGTTNFFADNITVGTSVQPPLEVSGAATLSPLMFTTDHDMIWEDGSLNRALSFNLYRGDITTLQGGSYGDCFLVGVPYCWAGDPWFPPTGTGWFYLVTGVNALGEGTMGTDSAGSERLNTTPCP